VKRDTRDAVIAALDLKPIGVRVPKSNRVWYPIVESNLSNEPTLISPV